MRKMNKKEILRRLLNELPISQSFSRAAEILALSEIEMKEPILDLGCGDGLFTDTLFGGVGGAVKAGVDISPKEVKLACRRAVYQEVKVADAASLPYPDGFFATVMSNSSVEHMEHSEKVLGEVGRILQPGGKFIFLVPHPGTDNFFLNKVILEKVGLRSLAKITARLRHYLIGHLHLLDQGDWQKKLHKTGFNLLEYRFVGGGKNYLVIDLFYPFFLLGKLFKKLFNRYVFPPRQPVIFFAEKFLSGFLPPRPLSDGPGLLIVAQKQIELG